MIRSSKTEEYLFQEECFSLINIASNIQEKYGFGLDAEIYKNAFELQLKLNKIKYVRNKQYAVNFNGLILQHSFYTDFLIDGKIIVELKSVSGLMEEDEGEILSKLVIYGPQLGLIINFNNSLLQFRKVLLDG